MSEVGLSYSIQIEKRRLVFCLVTYRPLRLGLMIGTDVCRPYIPGAKIVGGWAVCACHIVQYHRSQVTPHCAAPGCALSWRYFSYNKLRHKGIKRMTANVCNIYLKSWGQFRLLTKSRFSGAYSFLFRVKIINTNIPCKNTPFLFVCDFYTTYL